MKISCVIIAGNEENNIADAVESVSFLDEVLVIDSESSDRTREIARSKGARVIVQPWLGFAGQKQFGVDKAENDWVFSLDADERVSNELRTSLEAVRGAGPAGSSAFKASRLTRYMGRYIKHGGWYPDWQVRLFDRTRGGWSDLLVHESFKVVDGARVGTLEGDIIHFSVTDASHHHRMIGERYAPLAAEQMYISGMRTTPLRIASAGTAAFIRSYFLKLGFLDGLPGFAIAKFASHHAFLKHLLLYERQKHR